MGEYLHSILSFFPLRVFLLLPFVCAWYNDLIKKSLREREKEREREREVAEFVRKQVPDNMWVVAHLED